MRFLRLLRSPTALALVALALAPAAAMAAVKAVGERRKELSRHAKRYAAKHQWQTVIDAWLAAIDGLEETKR